MCVRIQQHLLPVVAHHELVVVARLAQLASPINSFCVVPAPPVLLALFARASYLFLPRGAFLVLDAVAAVEEEDHRHRPPERVALAPKDAVDVGLAHQPVVLGVKAAVQHVPAHDHEERVEGVRTSMLERGLQVLALLPQQRHQLLLGPLARRVLEGTCGSCGESPKPAPR